MVNIKKPQPGLSIEEMDRELIARGAQNLDEIFKFKDSVGTPARDYIMARIKELYASTSYPSSNEMISQIDTWTLARGLISKVRKEGIEKNRTRGIWYADHRMDYFGIKDKNVKENADSVAAVIFSEDLIEEKKGMSRIRVKNYGEVFNLWQGENFRDQPISAGRISTGFLVEKDVIAITPHYARMADVKKLRFVFGYCMLSSKKAVIRIPGKDIYKGNKIRDYVLTLVDGTDYSLVQLDREVEGREVLELSRGEVSGSYEIYVLGHPCGLPLKYAPGARVQHVSANHFAADLDVYMSNSGSPVFNSETHEVIGMVSSSDSWDFFRWTGRGWASVIYPGRDITTFHGSLCTSVSNFFNKVRRGNVNIYRPDNAEEKQEISPNESEKFKKKIFISYSHSDKDFVNRLTEKLENAGIGVWVDEKKIKVGDSISKKIEKGISQCDFFCMIISGHSVKSKWVEREFQTALNKQLSSGKPVILPLLIEDVQLPSSFLKDIKYADFSKDYKMGLMQLLNAVKKY